MFALLFVFYLVNKLLMINFNRHKWFTVFCKYLYTSGFPKLFLQMTPFKEIEKAMVPFNNITQKHQRPFFCSSSATQEYIV